MGRCGGVFSEVSSDNLAWLCAGRAEVVKQKKELSAKSANKSEPHRPNKGQTAFVADTAKKTGRSKRSVEADKSRGEKIAKDVQKEITGTDIEDSGVQLDALAKALPDEQRKAVKEVNLGHAKDVRDFSAGTLSPTARLQGLLSCPLLQVRSCRAGLGASGV